MLTSDRRRLSTHRPLGRLHPGLFWRQGNGDMTSELAYHVVVHAIEGKGRLSPAARFSLAAWHTVDGHLPYARYLDAGLRRQKHRSGPGAIELAVGEWLETDLNPAVQAVRCISSPQAAIAAYNAYNGSARLGVRTTAIGEARAGETPGALASREVAHGRLDPEPCQVATIAVLHHLMRRVSSNAAGLSPPAPNRLTDVARHLGLESSAACHVAAVFEAGGPIHVDALAKALGCGRRTLERRLREEGIGAELIRRAARMAQATAMLRGAESLTEIAIDAGFSDLAHMTRGFQSSCGMTPSLLRRALKGNLHE